MSDEPYKMVVNIKADREAQRHRAGWAVPVSIDEAVWQFYPYGHRILVVREDPLVQTEGGLYIPGQSIRASTVGWVLLAGAEVGMPVPGKPPPVPVMEPLELAGQKVLFGTHVGEVLKLSAHQDDYEGKYIVMTEWDLWGAVYPTEETPQ